MKILSSFWIMGRSVGLVFFLFAQWLVAVNPGLSATVEEVALAKSADRQTLLEEGGEKGRQDSLVHYLDR